MVRRLHYRATRERHGEPAQSMWRGSGRVRHLPYFEYQVQWKLITQLLNSELTSNSEKYIKLDGLVDNVRKMLAEEKRKSRQASLRSASVDDSAGTETFDLLRKDTIL